MSVDNRIISLQQWSTVRRHVCLSDCANLNACFCARPCVCEPAAEASHFSFAFARRPHRRKHDEGGQASLNGISVCWKTSGGESIMLPLTGQRWDINIYSRLLQITFRGFSLHFLSLIGFCCLGPLRFQAVCPTLPPPTRPFICIVSLLRVLSITVQKHAVQTWNPGRFST